MDKFTTAGFAILLVAAAAAVIFKAFKKRTTVQEEDFGDPAEYLLGASEPVFEVSGHYVATTYRHDPLNRITAYGLGFRGKAGFLICPDGLQINRVGERSIAIQKSHIVAAETDQVAIDRVVEKDGLIRVDWTIDKATLSTFLRVVNQADSRSLLTHIQSFIK